MPIPKKGKPPKAGDQPRPCCNRAVDLEPTFNQAGKKSTWKTIGYALKLKYRMPFEAIND
jgi:hypothetical protein